MNSSGRHHSGKNQQVNTRNANRKQPEQQQKRTVNTGSTNKNNNRNEYDEEQRVAEENEREHELVLQSSTQEEREKQSDDNSETNHTISPSSTHAEDEQIPIITTRQSYRNRPMNNSTNLTSSKEENFIPLKFATNMPPVRRVPTSLSLQNSSNRPRSNEHYPPSFNNCTYSAYNPLPPRFRQQQQQQQQQQQKQEDAPFPLQQRRRRGGRRFLSKRSSLPPGSAARSNEFVPSSSQQQEDEQDEQTNSNPIESSDLYVQQQEQELMMNNGYSSGSDILTDSPSIGENNSVSPLLSTSAGSQSSLQRLELVRSLATSHALLDDLISIFDTMSFSSDELEMILSKIASKHLLDKNEFQRLISTSKNERSFERILDENYRSQAKILAIELQTEKNRVLELTKTNADMENTIRQLQQQQQSQQMLQYQHVILPLQVHARRLTEENTRFQHQLHAYSMMPATITELKQQQNILSEQMKQVTGRNTALENEAVDNERATKHAAEIYKKADAQKQDKIEQMLADINKYKKSDKELIALHQKYNQLESDFNSKTNGLTEQRDQLQSQCDQFQEGIQQYERLRTQYDELVAKQARSPNNTLEQELDDLKTKHEQLRQRNQKVMDELNKLLNEQKQQTNPESPSSP